MKQVTLVGRVREAALDHAAGAYPFEGCGLLIGHVEEDRVRVSRALPCPNVAEPEERTHRFVIDPRAWWLDDVDAPQARELKVHVPPVRATAAACE